MKYILLVCFTGRKISLKKHVSQLEPEILAIFEHLHANPEISWAEIKTTAYIQRFLEKEGIPYTLFGDFPGLIATMGTGQPVVAIRADMDALWQEVDGVFQANHSCGHDAHMAIAMGVILYLKRYTPNHAGTIKIIFQPAEENGSGAKAVVKKGYVDDIDFLYGVHLRPVEELPLSKAAPAIKHGAAIFIEGEIEGEDTHGARPHLGANAFEVGVMLHNMLQQVRLSPMEPSSIKVTRFQTGSTNLNIIPGSANFGLDIRAQTNQGIDTILTKTKNIFHQLEWLFPVNIEVKVKDHTPAALVSEQAAALMNQAIVETVGPLRTSESIVTPGSDDFHFYTKLRPHIKATMLALGADLKPGLHHPNMGFNHSCILTGVEILSRVVIATTSV